MSYRKGYMSERELVHKLHKKGFMVVRTPRSGRMNIPLPDIIAVKKGRIIVIECKSRKNGFTVPMDQLEQLRKWESLGGASAFIGWKIPYKGWSFLKLNDVVMNKGNVGKKFISEKGISIDEI